MSVADLDENLLIKLWPLDRLALGVQVSTHLRTTLAANAKRLLIKMRRSPDLDRQGFSAGLVRFKHPLLTLRVFIDGQFDDNIITNVVSTFRLARESGFQGRVSALSLQHMKSQALEEETELLGVLSSNDCSALSALHLYNCFDGAAPSRGLMPVLECSRNLKTLNLPWNGLLEQDVAAIVVSTRTLSSLSRLDLSHNRIGSGGAAYVASALVVYPGLLALHLSHNNIRLHGIMQLANELVHVQALEELDVSFNPFDGDDNDVGFEQLGTALGRCPRLKMLNLSQTNLADQSAAVFARGLSSTTSLTELRLQNNIVELNAPSLFAALSGCLELTTIDISCTDRFHSCHTSGVLPCSLSSCLALTNLTLHGNSIWDCGVAVRSLASCASLEHLDLSYTGLWRNVSGLSLVVPQLTKLRSLDLARNYLGPRLWHVTSALAACSSLQSLNASENALGAAEEDWFEAGGARSPAASPQHSLSRPRPPDRWYREGLEQLFDHLTFAPRAIAARLEERLAAQSSGHAAEREAVCWERGLEELLQRCSSLKHIDLRYNSLPPRVLEVVARCLCGASSVQCVRLEGNGLRACDTAAQTTLDECIIQSH